MEDGKLTFAGAAAAVSWAEEVLDKQGARSQLGKLMKRGLGEMTEDEARDFAHTIVMIVSGYHDRLQAEAFSYFYGRGDHHRESTLIEELTRRMIDLLLEKGPDKLKSSDQLRDLSLAVLRSQRDLYLFNRHHPRTRIARFVGVPKQSFSNKKCLWPELYGMTKSTVRKWVDDGEKGLNDLLRERGFVV